MVGRDAIRRARDAFRHKGRGSSLPGTELIAMSLVVSGAVEFLYRVLGITNPFILAVFAVAWLRPMVTRLSELRRGLYLPWNICATRRFETAVLLIGGAAPWAMLGLLHKVDPLWVALQPVELPVWVRSCGAVLTSAMIAMQKARARASLRSSLRVRLSNVTSESQLLVVSMFMMSGSVFIGLIAAGLVLAWVAFSIQGLPMANRILACSRLRMVSLDFRAPVPIRGRTMDEVSATDALAVGE